MRPGCFTALQKVHNILSDNIQTSNIHNFILKAHPPADSCKPHTHEHVMQTHTSKTKDSKSREKLPASRPPLASPFLPLALPTAASAGSARSPAAAARRQSTLAGVEAGTVSRQHPSATLRHYPSFARRTGAAVPVLAQLKLCQHQQLPGDHAQRRCLLVSLHAPSSLPEKFAGLQKHGRLPIIRTFCNVRNLYGLRDSLCDCPCDGLCDNPRGCSSERILYYYCIM